VPEFEILYKKLYRHVEITGKSNSTLTNYGRCLATMALHFNCSPPEPDKDQVLDYLQYLKNQSTKPSQSYFKHTVYGLRLAYKVMGMDIMTLKDLLGHVDIRTTLVYLHVAQLGCERAFNPLNKLYKPNK
jgi:hypothetical protein